MHSLYKTDFYAWIQEHPSLKPYLEEALQEAYENGRDLASGETNLSLSTLPKAYS
ncbi:DUF29 family protein [Chroococcidiopsis sp. CCMEE 29]|uniref:DUF29 family protein n=1 Tax=Chroococcidiopsis sp. CCMEE 29 TaxID=155894 RepID=UPI0020218A15|nr:DUF29 family protein [Chroococcidiopsis sp. CCMEE 29]